MSPKPSALAAPGMVRAIINTNGFFPLDIAYSRVPLEHCDIAVAAVPIAHHEYIRGKCYATQYRAGYSCFPRLRRSSRMFSRAGGPRLEAPCSSVIAIAVIGYNGSALQPRRRHFTYNHTNG